MYELPSRADVTKCVIDGDVVARKVNPTLVPLKETKKRERQERSA
jgi:ATP-dependent protease Clp ATPase subunit